MGCFVCFDKLKNKYFVSIEYILFILLTILHFVTFFFIKKVDYQNIFDVFESSPLFNFSIESNCIEKSNVVFHLWKGKKKNKNSDAFFTGVKTEIVDETNIVKINGYFFCYNHISYRDLLYKNQIIKKEEQCGIDYPKDCGTIDTLEQHLCIRNEESCPLYDVGIGKYNNSEDFKYNKGAPDSDIYYNNNNYNDTDKKIIGKLILNDGQPCYKINEKLWRKFDSKEAGKTHLKCKIEIFGKSTDDRYINKGDITYAQIYKDNLGYNFNLVSDDLNYDEKVSLYKREFLGIDKTCDENSNIDINNYNKLEENQIMIKAFLLVEFIVIIVNLLMLVVSIIQDRCRKHEWTCNYCFSFCVLLFLLLFLFVWIICQGVFLGRINHYNFTYYCSDEITNEVFRQENKNIKQTILLTSLNLAADIFVIIFNGFSMLISFLLKKKFHYKNDSFEKSNSNINETEKNISNNISKNIKSTYKYGSGEIENKENELPIKPINNNLNEI